ncbi:MAG TPA: pyridoxal phosphate-dependent aminotransferase [Saprospiraceae bacterium]|nr:pyridoxal phosphate-dependent aminotransferase [Saprospiraceae bacterium]HRK82786.1 pyridoxal phosphate-dependent aminotransferase [Saprospiraceae bacterium]
MPKISQRGECTPLSPFRKFAPLAERAKAQGRKIYHLNIGQPDILTPPQALQAVREHPLRVLAYSSADGNLSYRQKLTGYYRSFGVELAPNQIIVTTGASEAIYLGLLSCFNQGDEILSPEPFYANYNGFAHMADIEVRAIPCRIEDGFALPSAADFERCLTPKTKGIFLCNPNNPTGCVYPEATLRELAEVVKRHDLYLFVDEVYREFCYDGQDFFSALRLDDIREHVVVVDSISKRYSACGARIGALITYNERVLEAVNRYAMLRLSPPGFGQILAEAALDVDAGYLDEVKIEYDLRRQTVFRRLQQMPGVTSYLPGGAFYCFARFPIDDADKFCRWLLEDFEYQGATVMLSPGAGFYATPGAGLNEVRMAYVICRDDLEAAMDCLERALMEYPGRVETALPILEEAIL